MLDWLSLRLYLKPSQVLTLQRDIRRLIVGGFSFLSSLLMPRRMGVFGEKLKLITMQCCVCQTWIALRVDPEDVKRHKRGVLVQDAFVNRAGRPYLTAAERELFVSKCPSAATIVGICSPSQTHWLTTESSNGNDH